MYFFFSPQSGGDNISFNAGLQGIKGDAAQHLERETVDENRPVFSQTCSRLGSHLRLSPLEEGGAMQRLEEVDLARNVPQIRQLPPITPAR